MDKKKIVFLVISILVCLLVYLPTPKGRDPQEYQPSEPINLEEIKVQKNKFDNAVFIITPTSGAEDVEIDSQGFIYSGLSDGSIIRIKPDNSEINTIAKSQGHIFGIDINSKGDKLALADQISGIKLLDLKTGSMEFLVSEYNGTKFASPNAVVFGQNDQYLYFTVSSDNIKMSEFHQMLLYSDASGKIFSFNLKTKQIELLAENLYFVNGLEYSAKDNCLYFVETSRSRVMKMQLSNETRGKITLVLDNIFGYPDNVKLSESGDLWVAIPALRDSFSNIIDSNSIIRRVALNLRMPLSVFLSLANMKYAGGIKVNPQTGEIIQYFFGEGSKIDCISGINEHNGKVYLSSLSQNKIAIVDLQKLKKEKQGCLQKQNETVDRISQQGLQKKLINCQGQNCKNNIDVKVEAKTSTGDTYSENVNQSPEVAVKVNIAADVQQKKNIQKPNVAKAKNEKNVGGEQNVKTQKAQTAQRQSNQQRPVGANTATNPNQPGARRVNKPSENQPRQNQQRRIPKVGSQL